MEEIRVRLKDNEETDVRKETWIKCYHPSHEISESSHARKLTTLDYAEVIRGKPQEK